MLYSHESLFGNYTAEEKKKKKKKMELDLHDAMVLERSYWVIRHESGTRMVFNDWADYIRIAMLHDLLGPALIRILLARFDGGWIHTIVLSGVLG